MPFVVKGLVDAVGEIFILFRMIVYVYYTDFNFKILQPLKKNPKNFNGLA